MQREKETKAGHAGWGQNAATVYCYSPVRKNFTSKEQAKRNDTRTKGEKS
jgi:hypothetical protein